MYVPFSKGLRCEGGPKRRGNDESGGAQDEGRERQRIGGEREGGGAGAKEGEEGQPGQKSGSSAAQLLRTCITEAQHAQRKENRSGEERTKERQQEGQQQQEVRGAGTGGSGNFSCCSAAAPFQSSQRFLEGRWGRCSVALWRRARRRLGYPPAAENQSRRKGVKVSSCSQGYIEVQRLAQEDRRRRV